MVKPLAIYSYHGTLRDKGTWVYGIDEGENARRLGATG